MEDSDSSPGAATQQNLTRASMHAHARHAPRSYAVPSEAVLQSIVDECCAAAAASGRLQWEALYVTEHSSSRTPADDKDFLSQCAALSEALSRTSDSGALSSSTRLSRSQSRWRRTVVETPASRAHPARSHNPSPRHVTSGSVAVGTGAAVHEGQRSRTRTR